MKYVEIAVWDSVKFRVKNIKIPSRILAWDFKQFFGILREFFARFHFKNSAQMIKKCIIPAFYAIRKSRESRSNRAFYI